MALGQKLRADIITVWPLRLAMGWPWVIRQMSNALSHMLHNIKLTDMENSQNRRHFCIIEINFITTDNAIRYTDKWKTNANSIIFQSS